MKWLRLLLAMVVFPLSLVWYKRDIQHYGISPVLYWVVMTVWVVANIVATVYTLQHIQLPLALPE